MAQDLTPKLRNIAGDSTVQARNLLQALESLVNDAAVLLQSGGNFPDGGFDGTQLAYLTAYQANVFLQTVVPAVSAFLDTHIGGDAAQPTHREYFEIMVSGPY